MTLNITADFDVAQANTTVSPLSVLWSIWKLYVSCHTGYHEYHVIVKKMNVINHCCLCAKVTTMIKYTVFTYGCVILVCFDRLWNHWYCGHYGSICEMWALSSRCIELRHSVLCHLQQEHPILSWAAFVADGCSMTRTHYEIAAKVVHRKM